MSEYQCNQNISCQNNPFNHMMLHMKQCENGKEFVDQVARYYILHQCAYSFCLSIFSLMYIRFPAWVSSSCGDQRI